MFIRSSFKHLGRNSKISHLTIDESAIHTHSRELSPDMMSVEAPVVVFLVLQSKLSNSTMRSWIMPPLEARIGPPSKVWGFPSKSVTRPPASWGHTQRNKYQRVGNLAMNFQRSVSYVLCSQIYACKMIGSSFLLKFEHKIEIINEVQCHHPAEDGQHQHLMWIPCLLSCISTPSSLK